jgi:hypothetical protein
VCTERDLKPVAYGKEGLRPPLLTGLFVQAGASCYGAKKIEIFSLSRSFLQTPILNQRKEKPTPAAGPKDLSFHHDNMQDPCESCSTEYHTYLTTFVKWLNRRQEKLHLAVELFIFSAS